MSTWFERFKTLRIEKELSQQVIADALGKDTTAISRYENGKGSKDMPFTFKKNLTNLFTQEELGYIETGEMIKLDQPKPSSSVLVDTDKFVSVPIMSAKAGAGTTGPAHYEVYSQGELLIDRILFRVIPNLKNVRAIEVDGDSMRPTLNEGDFVIIEENSVFSGEGIYVLQYDGVLLVKRLQPDFDGIEILSDNPNYKTRKFNPSDNQSPFHIVGKVILKVQR